MSILLRDSSELEDALKAAWLEKRRQYVTSTDVPVLFDQGYSGSSPIRLFHEKVTGVSTFEESERMEIGRLVQPIIAQIYEKKTGRKVVPADSYTLHVSEKYPWLATSLDAFDAEGAIVEIKNHADYVRDLSDVPTGWLLQVQTQMLVMDRQLVRLAIMCRGSEVVVLDIEPHPVQAKILEKSKVFWEQVQSKTCPAPEFPDDNAALGLVFGDEGENVTLGDDVLEACLQRAGLLDEKKRIVDELDLVEASVKYAMRSASTAILPDESKVTWKADKNGRRSLRYYKAK
jgi:putative phage-type endonuclease